MPTGVAKRPSNARTVIHRVEMVALTNAKCLINQRVAENLTGTAGRPGWISVKEEYEHRRAVRK